MPDERPDALKNDDSASADQASTALLGRYGIGFL